MDSGKFIHNNSHYKIWGITPASQGHFIFAFLYTQRIYCIIYFHPEKKNECRHFQFVSMYEKMSVFIFLFSFKHEVNLLYLWSLSFFLSLRICDSIIRNRLEHELLFYFKIIWNTHLSMVIVEIVFSFPDPLFLYLSFIWFSH